MNRWPFVGPGGACYACGLEGRHVRECPLDVEVDDDVPASDDVAWPPVPSVRLFLDGVEIKGAVIPPLTEGVHLLVGINVGDPEPAPFIDPEMMAHVEFKLDPETVADCERTLDAWVADALADMPRRMTESVNALTGEQLYDLASVLGINRGALDDDALRALLITHLVNLE